MLRPESIAFNQEALMNLRRLVRQGEGQNLEFKRKASFPDKIVRELIAFANTSGGVLLVGVDDDGAIPGVKFPEEESMAIQAALQQHCRPMVQFSEEIIPVTEKKFVLRWSIPVSARRPHFFTSDRERFALVRHKDQSIKASKFLCEIIRRQRKVRDIKFTIGDAEQKLFQYLEERGPIDMAGFSKLTGLNRFLASRKLVKLVLAGVIRIIPSEKGDIFERVG